MRYAPWALACTLACTPTAQGPAGTRMAPAPTVTAVEFPEPALPGSPVRVLGTELGDETLDRIVLAVDTGRRSTELELARDAALPTDPGWRWFRLDPVSHGYLGGAGSFAARCELRVSRPGARVGTAAVPCSLRLAAELAPAVAEDISAEVYRDDRFVVRTEELLLPGEGQSLLEIEGSFTPEGKPAVPVLARLPFSAAEAPRRDRGVLVASSALGGIRPGTLDATMTLVTTRDAVESRAPPRRLALRFRWPEVHALATSRVALGQLLEIDGAGFVASDDGDAGTRFELSGTFTPDDGPARPCCSAALIPQTREGRRAWVEIEAEPLPEARVLASTVFGAARGRFDGSLVAVTTDAADRVDSVALPVSLTLGVRQIVYVHFVAAFDASLDRFGLGAANAEVREATLDRVRRIYADYAVELRSSPPADYSSRGYATLEIGGPDPNGVGLFGYDNTPGKDVGNLRLFDKIGGLNALTQQEADGAPGFGGVFIESFLYWSEAPDLPGERPIGAPLPEPSFDALFGPVRARPATPDEVAGTAADPARIVQVAEAIRALGAIIGETAAHELGHSLGLAEPYGSASVFHSLRPDEGCLMDEGGERPFAERAELPGSTPSRFCADEPRYLTSILGRF